MHAQQETLEKQEKSVVEAAVANPQRKEESLENTIDSIDASKIAKRRSQRRAKRIASEVLQGQHENSVVNSESTKIQKRASKTQEPANIRGGMARARTDSATDAIDMLEQEETLSEQSGDVIFPGAVHVGGRLSDSSIFSAVRQQMSQQNQGSGMDPSPDDDMSSEFCALEVSANLVSENGKDEIVVPAEPIQTWLPRKTLTIIVLIILFVGNLTLGLVFSRKNRQERTDPAMTESKDDNDKLLLNSEPILQTVKDRGFIRCKPDETELSQNEGFTLDLCRAIAAAIFDDVIDGNTDRIQYIDLPFGEQFNALWNGTIDVSTAIVTHTMVRDIYEPSTGKVMAFSTPIFYDGMRFSGRPTLVDCAERLDSLIGECRDLSACALAGTTHVKTLHNILPEVAIHEGAEVVNLIEMFLNGTCRVIASEVLHLKEQFVRDMGYEGDYTIGSKLFSNEPLTIASKGDDQEWADFCNWILQALITAEALDIAQETALSSSLWSDVTMSGNFLETSSFFGDEYKNMFRNAIAAVGNYGELYEQHFENFAPRITTVVNNINYGESGLLYSFPFGDLTISDSTTIPPPGPMIGGTLESIARRGILRCGISGGRPGFALLESSKANVETSTWTGLNIEYCRAIAAALFPKSLDEDVDQDNVIEFLDVGSNEQYGYVAIDDDRIDIFVGGSMTLSTDIKETMTGKGFMFSPPYFYYDTDDMMSTMFIAKNIGLSLVTRETDSQWSAFVRWISIALAYAEEHDITQGRALDMPVVELFGLQYLQMFRDAVLAVGNYGEMFDRTLTLPELPVIG